MKKQYIYLLFLSGIFLLSLMPHTGHRFSGQAPLERTGAPGESSCAACHSGGDFTGESIFTFGENEQGEYVPGETYTISFEADYDAPRFGFSVTALDADEMPAGDFTLLNEDNTSFGVGGNDRQYVGHKDADATNTWTFEWTAPDDASGDVTFYYVANAANADNGTGGDMIETGSSSFTAAEEPAETFTLTFIVQDENEAEIPDAIITLGEETFDAGVYVFEDLPPGEYTYVVAKDGYISEEGTAIIEDADETIVVTLITDETDACDLLVAEMKMYPNPAHSIINLEFAGTLSADLSLFDLQGRSVYEMHIHDNTHQINVSDLPTGIYYLRITTKDSVSTLPVQINE